MTLEKPVGQECGNCYYCLSKEEKTNQQVNKGFLQYEMVEVIDVKYECRRSSQFPELIGSSSWNGLHFEIISGTAVTGKDYWCGEWKQRE
jgi:hypothetical protein